MTSVKPHHHRELWDSRIQFGAIPARLSHNSSSCGALLCDTASIMRRNARILRLRRLDKKLEPGSNCGHHDKSRLLSGFFMTARLSLKPRMCSARRQKCSLVDTPGVWDVIGWNKLQADRILLRSTWSTSGSFDFAITDSKRVLEDGLCVNGQVSFGIGYPNYCADASLRQWASGAYGRRQVLEYCVAIRRRCFSPGYLHYSTESVWLAVGVKSWKIAHLATLWVSKCWEFERVLLYGCYYMETNIQQMGFASSEGLGLVIVWYGNSDLHFPKSLD
jgi:hypothetical protein